MNAYKYIDYRNNYCYSPCVPYVWEFFRRLDNKGLLVPKLRPAIKMSPKQSTNSSV